MHSRLTALILLAACQTTLRAAEPTPQPSYNRDILPVLAENCFACHGADSNTREAGLRLDQREEAIDYGAIDPGSPNDSELVARIMLEADDEALMPPAKSHKSLNAEEKELLKRWIAEGAEYEPHWSFIPPVKHEPPAVENPQWVRNPIDQFVLAKLEAQGVTPAPEADRRAIARRASLDVTGLPPEPAWVEKFVNDTESGAYERYLTFLFSQPSWGEHRGRHWLDYARYADTHGIHFDNFRLMWAYRDWVIKAFNDNKPFDQFSIEQLAGDLLESPTLDQRIATGFHRCNITTNEGGIIDEEYKVLYARDRTETTGAVWMGMTVGCAVCHDHKFDPISAKEFYSLSAFFNNTTQAVRDGNQAEVPPVVVVPLDQDRTRASELIREIPKAQKTIEQIESETVEKLSRLSISAQQIAASLPHDEQLVLHAPLGDGSVDGVDVLIHGRSVPLIARGMLDWTEGLTRFRAIRGKKDATLPVGSVADFDTHDAFTVAAWVYPEKGDVYGSIAAKIDGAQVLRGWDFWLNGNRIAVHLVNTWPQSAIKLIAGDPLPVNQWSHVALINDGGGKVESLRLFVNGVEQTKREIANNSLGENTIRCNAPLTIAGRDGDSAPEGVRINDLRIYNAKLSDDDVQAIGDAAVAMFAAALPHSARDDQRSNQLARWYLQENNPKYCDGVKRLSELQDEQVAIEGRATTTHVMQEQAAPATAFLLSRGEYDQQLDQVIADVPASLPPLGELPHDRLGLARWLFRDDHPLTARVTVNRYWQEIFGTGLVRTSADFGIMGEAPSHPELLDYLAVTFRENGWDLQDLFRMILTSSTYRQSAVNSDYAIETDPENRLLSHGPRYRMDAEMLRDSALWASGLLVSKVGGPSVHPYQPPGVWSAVAMPESNTKTYVADRGEALYRRSMYTFWKRAAPPASMEILGAPSREVCTIRRELTNTPLQALVTLNDTQFVEAARRLASMTIKEVAVDESDQADVERMQFAAARLLSRELRTNELDVLKSAMEHLRSHYLDHPDAAQALLGVGESKVDESVDPVELAAWTMLASEMMNLDETICK